MDDNSRVEDSLTIDETHTVSSTTTHSPPFNTSSESGDSGIETGGGVYSTPASVGKWALDY